MIESNDTNTSKQPETPTTRSWLKNFGIGAMTGWGIVFITIIIAQIAALGKYWNSFLLIIAVIGALIFGIPIGGIGGLILSKIWRNNQAAYIGGAIAGVILAPFVFALFSFCGLLGGC